MAGTNLEALMAPQQQTANFAQPQATVTPEMLAQLMAPYMAQNTGAGVSQFLTGQMGIPMQFGVDLPQFETTQFMPGDFASFMRSQSRGTSEKPVIPVYNPQTGGYESFAAGGSSGLNRLFGGSSDSNILGYTQTGAPIYSSPPSTNNSGGG